MSSGCGVGAADLRPVLPVVQAQTVLHAVSAAPRIAAVTAAPELGLVIASLTIGVVRIGEVVAGTEGDCNMDEFKVLFTNAGDVALRNDGSLVTGRT